MGIKFVEEKRTELRDENGLVTSLSSFSFTLKGETVTFNNGVLTASRQIDELHVNGTQVIANRARTRARKVKTNE